MKSNAMPFFFSQHATIILAALVLSCRFLSGATQTLVATGSVWKYLDNGANLGTAWRTNTFNDAAWASGPAPLGYGEMNVGVWPRTTNSFGPDANNKYITTYYRGAFSVTNAGAIKALWLRLLRDDGAVVYLNGVEVFRSNMPTGAVNYLTLATNSVSGTEETNFVGAWVSSTLLREGSNLLAVEVHQAAVNSSDLAFDLALVEVPSARERWKTMKYGFFTHYVWDGSGNVTKLPDGSAPPSIDYVADHFDAAKFANDLQSMGVEYVIFTAWHANFFPLFNSAAVTRALGFQRNSTRDMIGDMINAVTAKGIRVLLYTHPNQPVLYDYTQHNNMLNDIYAEMMDRYGEKLDGFYFDENDPGGNQQSMVDYPRLERTIRSRNPEAVMIQNFYGNIYACDSGVGESGPATADFSSNIAWATPSGYAQVMSATWSAQVPTNQYAATRSAAGIFRGAALAAGSNVEGGGWFWAAGPFPGGLWEQGVLETMQQVGAYIAPVAASIKNTYPSTSWPTSGGTGIGSLAWGVATRSTDDTREYIHVLTPPSGRTLTLPAPADGKLFGAARLLASGAAVSLIQTSNSVELTLTGTNNWDALDTVIQLDVLAAGGAGLVNNSHPSVRYDGASWAWQTNRGLGEFQNDVHAAMTDGDSFTFYFDGTDVEFITSRATDRGLVDIYVDGVFQMSVNLALASTNRATVFAKAGLARGAHTLKGVKRGGAVLMVDAFKVTESLNDNDTDVVSYGKMATFNNTDTASNAVGYISYTGNWSWQARDGGEYNSDIQWTAGNGDYFTITFYGIGVQFVGNGLGVIDFYLDYQFVKTVNMNASGNHPGVIGFDTSSLSLGWHQLKGVKTGGPYAQVDAYRVYSPASSQWSYLPARGAGDMQNDLHRTAANEDYVRVNFTGTGVDFIAEHTINNGTVQISLDDQVIRNVNQYRGTTLAQATTVNLTSLAAGPHTLLAVKKRGGAMSADAFRVYPTATTPASVPLVATGSVWKYLDTGTNPGSVWRSNSFNDSAWPSGPAMLGYGDANGIWPRTTNSFGPDANNKYITTYYRHAFTVANAVSISGLTLRVQRDDGAITYLNGAEIYRSNMPTGVVNSLTLAASSVTGADESMFFGTNISPFFLRTGTNVLAVEVHQSATNSTDLAFDLELVATKSFETVFLPSGSAWRYNDTGANLDTAWRETNYNDSAWPSGNAQFGFGDGDEATVIASNRQVTTYFRLWVNIPNPDDYAFTLSLLRDDGAVVYLNGAEVFRSNMPTGAVNYLTLAASSALPADETTTFYSAALAASQFVPGWNLLAVEVHQSATNSSDLSFDLVLSATPAPLVPKLSIASAGPTLTFAWPDWAGAFALYAATNLAAPIIWLRATNEPMWLSKQWNVRLPAGTNRQQYFHLQTP